MNEYRIEFQVSQCKEGYSCWCCCKLCSYRWRPARRMLVFKCKKQVFHAKHLAAEASKADVRTTRMLRCCYTVSLPHTQPFAPWQNHALRGSLPRRPRCFLLYSENDRNCILKSAHEQCCTPAHHISKLVSLVMLLRCRRLAWT